MSSGIRSGTFAPDKMRTTAPERFPLDSQEHLVKLAQTANEATQNAVYSTGSPTQVMNIWLGDDAQYAAITTKDDKTIYFSTDGKIYAGSTLVAEKNP